jgi:hypothetical protein
MAEHDIVFEDLHGVEEKKPVTVDLDADLKDAGIEQAPDAQLAAADTRVNDTIKIDELRSADESAEGESDEEDSASKASEDDAYSKKVRSRIDRERRLKLKERERADYWEKQAKAIAKERYETERNTLKQSVEQADSAYAQIQSDLKRAIEDGDTDDQVRLTTRLSDLKAEKVLAESRLENLSADGNWDAFDDNISAEPSKKQSLADKWMDGHSDWYGAKGFERQTRLANRIDKEVFAEGYQPDSPDYFEELDRRLKEKVPEVYDSLDFAESEEAYSTDNQPDRSRGRSVVAAVSGNESPQKVRSSKVELGAADFENMRRFGLDANDPETLKEYARNKKQAEGAR